MCSQHNEVMILLQWKAKCDGGGEREGAVGKVRRIILSRYIVLKNLG